MFFHFKKRRTLTGIPGICIICSLSIILRLFCYLNDVIADYSAHGHERIHCPPTDNLTHKKALIGLEILLGYVSDLTY
jgi:hypothetical protein